METIVSDLIKEDLLSGRSKYIKKSFLIFDQMILSYEEGCYTMELRHSGKFLGKLKCPARPVDNKTTFTFYCEGKIKVSMD